MRGTSVLGKKPTLDYRNKTIVIVTSGCGLNLEHDSIFMYYHYKIQLILLRNFLHNNRMRKSDIR